MTVVDPIRDERGWAFREGPGHGLDAAAGFEYLSEAYSATDPAFDGRVTVPVLWDKAARRIVNNSEDDICRMFNDLFNDIAAHPEVDLFPNDIAAEHERLAAFIYENVNNGVYRAGFATAQRAYEIACRKVFAALDELEARLATRRYLFGNRIVEADWRLFCTLIRFDSVYHGHFKCNIRRIVDYPNLQGYLMDLFQLPGIAQTVNFGHIKRHYYFTHDDINPDPHRADRPRALSHGPAWPGEGGRIEPSAGKRAKLSEPRANWAPPRRRMGQAEVVRRASRHGPVASPPFGSWLLALGSKNVVSPPTALPTNRALRSRSAAAAS